MGYQRERDEFIVKASAEGLSLPVIHKLLRYASTLQRLAVAQCNGDWPYENGTPERKVKACPNCEGLWVKSCFVASEEIYATPGSKWSDHAERFHARNTKERQIVKICPDCRTQEIVKALCGEAIYSLDSPLHHNPNRVTPVFGGDPRGAVLRLSTPNYPYSDNGANGYGLYVPARER